MDRRPFGFGLAAALNCAAARAALPPPLKQTWFLPIHEGKEGAFLELARRQKLFASEPSGVTVYNRVVEARSPNAPYQIVIETVPIADADSFTHDAHAMIGASTISLVTQSTPIKPLALGALRAAKRIGLVARRSDISHRDFVREWRDVHAPPVARQPQLSGYELNVAEGDDDPNSAWDGFAELWWPDWQACDAATAARLKDRVMDDFFHRSLLLYVEELPDR